MDKKDLRKEMLRKRNRLDADYIEAANAKITQRFLSSNHYRNCSTLFVYISYSSEVDTQKLIEQALTDGKTVLVPYTVVEEKKMFAVKITDFHAQLCPSCHGILEPNFESKQPYPPEDIDLIAVPGVAFDRKGFRIGYGGGYYDRFLPLAKNAIKIGFAYGESITDEIAAEAHDQKVDFILTEREEIAVP